eukprot:scpid17694/ scgid6665/ 
MSGWSPIPILVAALCITVHFLAVCHTTGREAQAKEKRDHSKPSMCCSTVQASNGPAAPFTSNCIHGRLQLFQRHETGARIETQEEVHSSLRAPRCAQMATRLLSVHFSSPSLF